MPLTASYPALPKELADHRGYARVFQPGHLTFGFIAPVESYPDSPGPTLANHGTVARKVDQAGFSAIWLRDVPFYDPNFGDVGQIIDPMVYAGYLAAITENIAIGTAGIVLPLRDPLIVAKQAASVDQLLGGRFILGLATGDRPIEYPAFGSDFDNRAERFRDALAVVRAATERAWPVHGSAYYGELTGNLDLVPKPAAPRLPTVLWAWRARPWIGSHRTPTACCGTSPIRRRFPTSSTAGTWQARGNPSSPTATAPSSIWTPTLTYPCNPAA